MILPSTVSLTTAVALLILVGVGSCDFCDAGSRARSPAPGAATQLVVGGAPSAS